MQALVAGPRYLFVETFQALLPLALGFAIVNTELSPHFFFCMLTHTGPCGCALLPVRGDLPGPAAPGSGLCCRLHDLDRVRGAAA
eukprot:scaffold157462_cov17-Tisochrysis_lutea.AAC.1